MTVVSVVRQSRSIVSVDCNGHAGFDVYGYDIVCAALSSILQTTVLGLMQVLGLSIVFDKDDDDGSLRFELPKLDSQQREKANILLDTMLLGIDNLSDTYSDFVQLNVKET